MAVDDALPRAKDRQQIELALHGGPMGPVQICGLRHSATLADEDERVIAVIRIAERGRSGARGRPRLVIERCNDGRWRRAGSRWGERARGQRGDRR